MNDTDENKGPDHSRLFEIASSQAGYFTAAQARERGFSYALLSHHAQEGKFTRLHRGIYRLRDYPSSPREDVLAAWLAVGSDVAVVSHESALDILGLADVVPERTHLTVPRSHRGRRKPPGVELHTAVRPPRGDEILTRQGMKVTAPARSIADAVKSGMAPEQALLAIRQALDRGMTTPARLLDRGAREGGMVERLVEQALSDMERE